MATDRLSELEQEIMQSDYDDEIAKVLKLADEDPGIQEFSLAAPAAKLRALSQLLNTGVSKVGAMIPQGAKEALEGLPSIMQSRGRRGGTGQGFERFNKRRGGTTSRVNQNLDGLISDFMAETRGGTRLDLANPYTIDLLKANLPAIRAAAARTKQNPKAGLNRVLQLLDELE
jgi:hypothetical protein|tara:strand:- start:513 stop:1031 length:519 start_codon:yes stop_codon:yes gene_type:complete